MVVDQVNLSNHEVKNLLLKKLGEGQPVGIDNGLRDARFPLASCDVKTFLEGEYASQLQSLFEDILN